MRRMPVFDRPALVQAIVYAAGGAWPLVAYRSFEAVTGSKREPWLVKTVGLLMLPIAAALAADPEGRTPVARRLGIGSAAAFAAIDVWYGGIRRRISPIYLLDAALEAGLIGLWLRASERDSRGVR